MTQNLVGFSEKIGDQAYDRYRKSSRKWSYIFSLILAIVAVVAFSVYGSVSKTIDFPYSLLYGVAIGGMFVMIATLQDLKRRKDTTWEGKVIDKKTYQKTEVRNVGGRRKTYRYTLYVLKVMRQDGKVYTHKFKDNSTAFDYYQIGDAVKHHRGLYLYEKYDKSKDSQILCVACGTFNDIHDDFCKRCKVPLLK